MARDYVGELQKNTGSAQTTKSQSGGRSALGAVLSGNFGDILPSLGRQIDYLGGQAQSDPMNFALGATPGGVSQQSGKIAGNIVKNAPNLAKVVTGRGLWEGMVDAAKSPVDWGRIESRVLDETKNETQPVRDEILRILKQEGPKTSNQGGAVRNVSGSPIVSSVSNPNAPVVRNEPRVPISKETLLRDQPLVNDGLPRGNPQYNIPTNADAPLSNAPLLPPTSVNGQMAVDSSGRLVSGVDALEKRVAIGQNIPTKFWSGQSNLDSAQSRAYAHVRDALSKELKLANPALEKADQLYGRNKSFQKAVPGLAAKLGIGASGALGFNLLKDLFDGSNPPAKNQ